MAGQSKTKLIDLGPLIDEVFEENCHRRLRFLRLTNLVKALPLSQAGLAVLARTQGTLLRELEADLGRNFIYISDRWSLDPPLNTDELIRYIVNALVSFHFIQAEVKEEQAARNLYTDLQAFGAFYTDIQERKAKDGRRLDVNRMFSCIRTDNFIFLQGLFSEWTKEYQVIVDRAKLFKKRIVSMRTSQSQLLPPHKFKLVEGDYAQYLTFLDGVIDPGYPIAEIVGSPGGKPRKNTEVWTSMLTALEEELLPFFRTKRHWELPGGFPGRAVPGELYKAINKILHFLYPSVWKFDPKTTASIKSRCQKHHPKK